jgi:ferritin-like metal-binding protein YciE
MAEPTLKDVLKAISELRAETKGDIAQVRSEMATKADLAKLDAKVEAHRAETEAHRAETEAHRAETKKGFADLDEELTRHADTDREIEKDIVALKGRPARTAARPTRRPRTR